jgi:putative membrane protein
MGWHGSCGSRSNSDGSPHPEELKRKNLKELYNYMLKRFLAGISLLALSGLGSLYAQQNNPQSNPQPSPQDKGFLQRSFQVNQFQIQMGQVAAQHATSNEVKQFANQLVSDHTNANNELQQLANSSGVQLNSNLDPKQQATLDRLQKADGKNFDREFLRTQMRIQRQNVAMLKKEADTGINPEIRGWASGRINFIQQFETTANNLYTQFSGAPSAQARRSYSGKSLPRTAGNMPLFGLFGALLFGAAVLMRSFRYAMKNR